MADEEANIGEDGEGEFGPHERTQSQSSPTIIDLEKLTDKVFRLMRDEIRLEIARGQITAQRRT